MEVWDVYEEIKKTLEKKEFAPSVLIGWESCLRYINEQ